MTFGLKDVQICKGRWIALVLGAVLSTLALSIFSAAALGEPGGRKASEGSLETQAFAEEREVDRTDDGERHAAGELIVAYENVPDRVPAEIAREAEGRVEEKIPQIDTQVLSFPEIEEKPTEEARDQALEEKMKELENEPAVEAVDLNYLRKPAYTPNDPHLGYLWGFKKIQAPPAWDRARGSGAKVAVVDTGIDYFHPEFSGKVALEKDFVDGDSYADDHEGHGTHVAGTIAANTGNGEGVSGVCPDCKLMAAKVLGLNGGYDSDIASGISWSASNGAKVINLSLGGPGYSSVLENAVNYAWDEGAVVVAAAGNDGNSTVSYPAAYPKVIAVAATNDSDGRAYFSNHGSWVDVAAPGVDILSTDLYNRYRYSSGTSMASPHVAGVAGLLAGQGLSNQQIRTRIETTAVDRGPLGKDNYYGRGRINALSAVSGEAPPTITSPSPTSGSKTRDRTPAISATVRDARTDLSASGITLRLDGKKITAFSYNTGNDRLSWTSPKLALGKHTVKVAARDGAGITRVVSWSFSVVR